RVASLESPAQEIARFGFRRGRVDRHPLHREPGAALEAPIGVFPGDPLADALVADVLEKTSPHDLADLGLIVGNEILGDTPNDLGDLVLPLLVPIRHFDLAAWQADDCRRPVGRRYLADQV